VFYVLDALLLLFEHFTSMLRSILHIHSHSPQWQKKTAKQN